jgi:phage terminase small subunit
MRPLTGKQRIWLKEYLKDFNGLRAARIAYPNQTEGSRAVQAHENLNKPNIKIEIEKALAAQGIDAKWVLGESVKILQNAKFDRDKLASLRLISDIAKFTAKEPSIIVGQSQGVFGDINDTLERLRQPKAIDCTAEKSSIEADLPPLPEQIS